MSRLIGFRLYRKTAARPYFRSMLFTFPFLFSFFFSHQFSPISNVRSYAQCRKIWFQFEIPQLYFQKFVAVCAQFICSRSKVDHLTLQNSRIVPNNFTNFPVLKTPWRLFWTFIIGNKKNFYRCAPIIYSQLTFNIINSAITKCFIDKKGVTSKNKSA